jgi:hypothetical protein
MPEAQYDDAHDQQYGRVAKKQNLLPNPVGLGFAAHAKISRRKTVRVKRRSIPSHPSQNDALEEIPADCKRNSEASATTRII